MSSEKRQFFRIQQDVIFDFKPVSTDAVAHISPEQHFDHANTFRLTTQFQLLDNDSHLVLEQLRKENGTLAHYLDTLNHKLNLLTQQLLANEAVSAHDRESGKVDLSQGGIGFSSNQAIGIESWLAVKLVFLPSYTALLTYAQVTRNHIQADGSYLIGARFHQLNDEQHRLIARQVMTTQRLQTKQVKRQVHH